MTGETFPYSTLRLVSGGLIENSNTDPSAYQDRSLSKVESLRQAYQCIFHGEYVFEDVSRCTDLDAWRFASSSILYSLVLIGALTSIARGTWPLAVDNTDSFTYLPSQISYVGAKLNDGSSGDMRGKIPVKHVCIRRIVAIGVVRESDSLHFDQDLVCRRLGSGHVFSILVFETERAIVRIRFFLFTTVSMKSCDTSDDRCAESGCHLQDTSSELALLDRP